MPPKPTTAAELIRRLEADPDYKSRRAQKEAKLTAKAALTAADERILVEELNDAGYNVESVWDLVNNSPHPFLRRRFVGPYPDAYPVLLRHLVIDHRLEVREGIIRALIIRDGGQTVEDALFREFQHETEPSLRWVLSAALKHVMPYSRRRKHPEIAQVYRCERRA